MYRVAVVQFQPELLNSDQNLRRLEEKLNKVQVDLVVLPELVTSGYVFDNEEELKLVSEIVPNGKSVSFFRELSQAKEMSIVFGFPEFSNGTYYNSSLLVNPDGTYHLYRKVHLFLREKIFFTPGDIGFNVYPAKGGIQIGMMICFDWQFPEAVRTLALKGAQIICHPANLVLPWCQQAMIIRSLENRVFSITANRIGTESTINQTLTFTGQSQILGTKGEILKRLSQESEEVGMVEINPEDALDKTVTDMNNAFADRRPAFYTELVKAK